VTVGSRTDSIVTQPLGQPSLVSDGWVTAKLNRDPAAWSVVAGECWWVFLVPTPVSPAVSSICYFSLVYTPTSFLFGFYLVFWFHFLKVH
jgi:hypothetical protein